MGLPKVDLALAILEGKAIHTCWNVCSGGTTYVGYLTQESAQRQAAAFDGNWWVERQVSAVLITRVDAAVS